MTYHNRNACRDLMCSFQIIFGGLAVWNRKSQNKEVYNINGNRQRDATPHCVFTKNEVNIDSV